MSVRCKTRKGTMHRRDRRTPPRTHARPHMHTPMYINCILYNTLLICIQKKQAYTQGTTSHLCSIVAGPSLSLSPSNELVMTNASSSSAAPLPTLSRSGSVTCFHASSLVPFSPTHTKPGSLRSCISHAFHPIPAYQHNVTVCLPGKCRYRPRGRPTRRAASDTAAQRWCPERHRG